jgi:hypothetical protein
MRLGERALIPIGDAGALLELMQHGRVLAVATAHNEEHAAVKADLLLLLYPQFDGVMIVPPSRQSTTGRLSRQARREAKRAYKEGLLHH